MVASLGQGPEGLGEAGGGVIHVAMVAGCRRVGGALCSAGVPGKRGGVQHVRGGAG